MESVRHTCNNFIIVTKEKDVTTYSHRFHVFIVHCSICTLYVPKINACKYSYVTDLLVFVFVYYVNTDSLLDRNYFLKMGNGIDNKLFFFDANHSDNFVSVNPSQPVFSPYIYISMTNINFVMTYI